MAADVGPDDRLQAAVDELYLDPPDGFVARRAELAKAARADGDKSTASAIAGLGRPTRAAWIVNRLARTDPDVVAALLELGDELRSAQAELSADSLRELSDRRRALVRDVAQRAFSLAEVDRPPTGLADEVQNTLNAAVIDADVGAAVQTATLLRATQASGFGAAGPALAVVPAAGATSRAGTRPKSPAKSGSAAPSASTAKSASPATSASAAKSARSEPQSAAAAKSEKERRQREEREARREQAQQALSRARETLDAARTEESERRERLRVLTEQVRAAERDLGDAGLAVREAKAALRTAERAQRQA